MYNNIYAHIYLHVYIFKYYVWKLYVSLAMITADTTDTKSMHLSLMNDHIIHSYALSPYLFLFNILFSYFLARS